MAKTYGPRHGSMQFWPRKRAQSEVPRVRGVAFDGSSPIDGFYGYKAGMTHVALKDSYSNSLSKNKTVVKPATIIECPPLKVVGMRAYAMKEGILSAVGDFFTDKIDSRLSKRMIIPGKKEISGDYDEIRLLCHTQPSLCGFGKKTPEFFEVRVKGNKDEQLAFAKEKLGKDISLEEVLRVNELIDIHGVTTGKGYQGPVKRFGVQIRAKKSEKTKRGPGSLGPWKGQQHIMYRVAHAGQTGYHLRTEYNKPIIYAGADLKQINPSGGITAYGEVKTSYIIVLGSVPGPKKRMLRLMHPMRPNQKKKTNNLELLRISTESQQR